MNFMSLLFPNINKVEESDIEDILSIINEAFPYVTFSKELIKEKLKNKDFFLVKLHQKNILVGFLELEFISKEIVRLNAIFISEAFRGQGFATELLKKAIHECKRKRVKKIFLLVKEENIAAKELYKKRKFNFTKFHDKELDSSKIEVWERTF
jgi:ribosomal protein S18 acetylase RimI-like enzyme